MNKTTVITIVSLLVLIVVGLLVYGFVVVPKQGGTTKPSGNNNTPGGTPSGGSSPPTYTGGVLASDLEALALKFRERFSSSTYAGNRCGVIADLNQISLANLKLVNDYYMANYNLNMKQEMDNAYFWCSINSLDDQLYDKLTNL